MNAPDLEDNTCYVIKGQRVLGLLGDRLEETAVTAINDLPGVLVPTFRGVYYSELYLIGHDEPIPKQNMDETTQGLTEAVTKEMAEEARRTFVKRRSLSYYRTVVSKIGTGR